MKLFRTSGRAQYPIGSNVAPTQDARWTRWLLLSLIVILLDQVTKALITRSLQLGDSFAVTPFFNLVLAHNPGAAFSFLADAGGWQRVAFSVIAIIASVVILQILRKGAHNSLFNLALALILGGAVGNLIDRLILGHVVDFIQLHARGLYWPAFNVADTAISIGAVLLIWDSFRSSAAKQNA